MVATSGSQLLPQSAVNTLIKELLPVTTILTPNLPEAKLLLQVSGEGSTDPVTVEDFINMAKSIQALGPKYVLLKGGHSPLTKDRRISTQDHERSIILSVLVGDHDVVFLESPYQDSKNTHGTGCTLACK
jgi:hydroxymethylpyrimidine kinase/phosphomethylpyrimidine kinase